MPIALPKPIADYVAANADLDVDAMVAPFTADATVLDNGTAYKGRAAVRSLFATEVIPVRAVFTPDTLRDETDRVIVEGFVRGSFPGSPLRFTYDFKLEDGAIAALAISL
jgi:hypothetical protein